MLDKHDVAAAAAGRWRAILLALCPGLRDSALNGYHQPCPKCGGVDRFRAFNDFDDRGGVYCNECFSTGNADGFSALQWWNGWKFSEALAAVADFLNLSPAPAMGGKPAPQNSKAAAKLPPQQGSEFTPRWVRWDLEPDVFRSWCHQWASQRRPIAADSVVESGAMVGNWPERSTGQVVIGWWGYAEDANPASLLLYRADGSEFPPMGKLVSRKTHLVGGSRASWIHLGGRRRTEAAAVVWRVEGVPDGLALLPLLPPDHAVVTPATGCGWNRLHPDRNPPLSIFDGKVVIAVGDADEPGQRGLVRFADAVQDLPARVFVAQLPYPICETHGKDLRDWIGDGGNYNQLQRLLRDWSKVRSAAADVFSVAGSGGGPSDRLRLTNYALIEAADKPKFEPKPMQLICGELSEMAGGWPRRVDDRLFVHDANEIVWLNKAAALFGWFGLRSGGNVDFVREGGVFTKEEVFQALQQSVTSYKSVEHAPHEPPMEGHYYTCGAYPEGNGERLNWLLDRFSPATEVDRHLILLLLATIFWGGAGGSRPAFMITANGRGAGKTTLAMIAAELAGGVVDISQREDVTKIKERLLTAEGKDKRLVLVDNIKATRLSWAELEALITCQVISGRELYRSESQRPNNLVWVLTMNGVGLSKDIAQRVVVIRLVRPEYAGTWSEDTLAFVREHRREIISDLIAFLRGPRDPLPMHSRWADWESQVLARLPLAADAQSVVLERQGEYDVDADEASQVEDYFRERLEFYRYDPSADVVFVPSRVANRWFVEASGDRVNRTKSTQALKGWIEEGAIRHLQITRHREAGRGFYWVGNSTAAADVSSALLDLEQRIEIEGRRPTWGPESD